MARILNKTDLQTKSTISDKEGALHNSLKIQEEIEIIKGRQVTPTIIADFNTPYSATINNRLTQKQKSVKKQKIRTVL